MTFDLLTFLCFQGPISLEVSPLLLHKHYTPNKELHVRGTDLAMPPSWGYSISSYLLWVNSPRPLGSALYTEPAWLYAPETAGRIFSSRYAIDCAL